MKPNLSRALWLAAALAAVPGLAAAEPRAVVVANSDYAQLPDLPGGDLSAAIAMFKRSGFRVVEGRDLRAADLRSAAADLLRPDGAPGPRVVVLKGRFVHSRGETWLLGQAAGAESLVSASISGLPLSTVAELIEGGAPHAVLLLASDDQGFATGPGLRPGWGPVAGRPGVTVIAGPPDAAARAAATLGQPGGSVAAALGQGGLRVIAGQGGEPAPVVVAPAPGGPVVVAPPPAVAPPPPQRLDDVVQPAAEEQAAWTRAKRANTVAAYREFLQKYPASLFAGAARGRMEALDADTAVPRPDSPAAVEAALGLNRAQQAQIERQLTLLTYDTRGIDGTFGADTRNAIARFQRDSGQAPTGYLTRGQVEWLGKRAAERTRQLEAESARRQAAADAADTAFWNQQRPAGAAGAERYLARYPQGLHAAAARKVLAEAARDPGVQDDQVWGRARAANGAAAYREYLDKYPRGRHADEARARLAELERQWAIDQAGEVALDLSPQVRLVIEQRLAAAGLDVGRADGRFDPQTRAAIRRYQASRNLRPSGFMNRATAVRLLADTLLSQD